MAIRIFALALVRTAALTGLALSALVAVVYLAAFWFYGSVVFEGNDTMLIYANSKNRPFHYGQFPLEMLPRDETVISTEIARPPLSQPIKKPVEGLLGLSANRYLRIFSRIAEGEPARARAPVPDDLQRRTADIKGLAYFLDAAQVGICRIPANAWLKGAEKSTHAVSYTHLTLPTILLV